MPFASPEQDILNACVAALQAIDGTGAYSHDLENRVYLGFRSGTEGRTEAGGQPYLEVVEDIEGSAAVGAQTGSAAGAGAGLAYTADLAILVLATVKAAPDAVHAQAWALNEDVRRAVTSQSRLPDPSGDATAYSCQWSSREPVGVMDAPDGMERFAIHLVARYETAAYAAAV